MGEFVNIYVLKSREDNGRCDVLAIFTDLIYVDVDEDNRLDLNWSKMKKHAQTIIWSLFLSFFLSFLFFFYLTFLKILCWNSPSWLTTFPTLSRFEGWVGVTEWKCVISCDMYIILCIERHAWIVFLSLGSIIFRVLPKTVVTCF